MKIDYDSGPLGEAPKTILKHEIRFSPDYRHAALRILTEDGWRNFFLTVAKLEDLLSTLSAALPKFHLE